MSDSTVEKREFKSELKQILNIITHSLYSHKEIFLRELLSNASDAIDKIRFNSLQNEALLGGDLDWKIRIVADPQAGTLTVSDNGVGMTREAIIEHLGTIARSGTREFLESLGQTEAPRRPELIGQFGVGFYSAFMVADSVSVVSRAAGEAQAIRWTSDGLGEFTVEPVERAGRGTDVILHLKEEEKEFLQEWRLRTVVKQFSDFIEHPIVMDVERKEEKGEKTISEEVLNSQKALWLRSRSDVTTEEHNAFYRQISGDFEDPAKVIHYAAEGALEFRALLYIPKAKSFDLQFGEAKVGPRLYINRVQIMDHCEQLLPSYLRFVRGVVDCPDLPLNVSRELLQHNPLLDKIQKSLVKNIFQTMEDFKTTDYEGYVPVFRELGGILKEGLGRDWANKEAIANLLLFDSVKTEKGKHITLAQYLEAMPSDQTEMYYMTGEDRATLEHSPVLETFRRRGWDVLLLTDPIDGFVFPQLTEYKGRSLKSADRNAPSLLPEDQKKVEEATEVFQPLLSVLKVKLTDVKDVRLSNRLTESAACLVTPEDGMDVHMERILQRLKKTDEKESPRILELNPDHPAVQGLLKIHSANPSDPRIEDHARLLHAQAVLAEGSKLTDPSDVIRRINELLVKDS
jgi:molecular chaperone HtpG